MFGFLLRILTAVILTGISAYLSYRKPEQPDPGTLDDLGNPRAEEGSEIVKVFGTVNIGDPQVVWFGDFNTQTITEKGPRKYGLFGPKQQIPVGFQYFLGIHFVVCLGPVDNVNRIRIDKRIAFSGSSEGGSIPVSRPNLFGASNREGGIGGTIDVMMGASDQVANDYLASRAGAPTPAYRGVVSLVMRSFYIGNSPSLRPWDVRVERIIATDEGYNGGTQWYPEKAAISRPGMDAPETDELDVEGTFYNINFIDPEYPAVGELHPAVLTIGPYPEFRLIVANSSGTRADDRYIVDGEVFGEAFETFPPGTLFRALSPGEVCTIRVRNEANFNCGAIGGIAAVVASSQLPDMNPVHILREILLSPDCGGTGNEAEMGSTWEAAADQIYTEQLGLSAAWRGSSDRVTFKKEIERHIDARSYIDRRTGLWEIKLIRDDYDEETLPVFDTTNVVSWSNINFPEPSSLLNQLVVTWTDIDKDETTSLTISNPARIRMAGSQIFQEKVEYPFITRSDLAGRLAMRDLSARSAPLITGEFVAKNFPTDLNLGSAIIVNNPRLGIVNRIVRVTEIVDGNIRENTTTVKFIEDKFSINDESPLEIEAPEVVVLEPEATSPRLVEEAPLQVLREQLGVPNTELVLADNSEAGLILIAGGKPSSISLDANVLRDTGSGYEEIGSMPFSPHASLLGAMTNRADHQKVVVQSLSDLSAIAAGTKATIGSEHVTVELVEVGDTSSPGDYWEPTEAATQTVFTLTLGRGVLDTVPSSHEALSALLVYGDLIYFEDDIQTDGDVVNIRLQTVSTQGLLPVDITPTDTVTFASRALRPYPPGDLRLDGDYQIDPPLDGSDYELTWEHRDRLVDETISHDIAGPVSPEAGTTYIVRVEALDGDGDVISVLTEVNVGDDTTYTWTPIMAPAGTIVGRMSVASTRDGIESWQRPSILVQLDIGARAFEDSTESRQTESDVEEIRAIEG